MVLDPSASLARDADGLILAAAVNNNALVAECQAVEAGSDLSSLVPRDDYGTQAWHVISTRRSFRRRTPLNEIGRAVARHEINQNDLATIRLDELAPHDLLDTIVGTLDQHLRPYPPDQFQGRVLLEDDDYIDRFEPRQHLGARLLRLHRPAFALEARDRGVTVEADNQPVTGAARLCEQPDMAGMQEIEAAVGEADAQALAA